MRKQADPNWRREPVKTYFKGRKFPPRPGLHATHRPPSVHCALLYCTSHFTNGRPNPPPAKRCSTRGWGVWGCGLRDRLRGGVSQVSAEWRPWKHSTVKSAVAIPTGSLKATRMTLIIGHFLMNSLQTTNSPKFLISFLKEWVWIQSSLSL